MKLLNGKISSIINEKKQVIKNLFDIDGTIKSIENSQRGSVVFSKFKVVSMVEPNLISMSVYTVNGSKNYKKHWADQTGVAYIEREKHTPQIQKDVLQTRAVDSSDRGIRYPIVVVWMNFFEKQRSVQNPVHVVKVKL